jgi:hypothetical protein
MLAAGAEPPSMIGLTRRAKNLPTLSEDADEE